MGVNGKATLLHGSVDASPRFASGGPTRPAPESRSGNPQDYRGVKSVPSSRLRMKAASSLLVFSRSVVLTTSLGECM